MTKDLHVLTMPKAKKTRVHSVSMFAICVSFVANCAYASPKKAEIVVDADNGRVLYEDMANEKRHPASITKVMTLYLLFDAIESGKVSLDDRVYFSRYSSSQKPTKLGIRAGDSIDVETAILSLVINSSNDTAVAVAEKLGGTEGGFARLMNSKALEIGMSSTNFANASGLPNPNNISTAEDLAKLAIAIRRDFPRQYHWFGRESFTFNGRSYHNHNHLVGKVEGVDGLKTGLTRASGYNLAATSTRDGRHLVTIVLGGKTWRTRDDRVTQLIETAYNQIGVNSSRMAFNKTNSNAYDNQYYNSRDNADAQALYVDSSFGSQIVQSTPVKLNVNFAQLQNAQKTFGKYTETQNDNDNNLSDDEDDQNNGYTPAPIVKAPIYMAQNAATPIAIPVPLRGTNVPFAKPANQPPQSISVNFGNVSPPPAITTNFAQAEPKTESQILVDEIAQTQNTQIASLPSQLPIAQTPNTSPPMMVAQADVEVPPLPEVLNALPLPANETPPTAPIEPAPAAQPILVAQLADEIAPPVTSSQANSVKVEFEAPTIDLEKLAQERLAADTKAAALRAEHEKAEAIRRKNEERIRLAKIEKQKQFALIQRANEAAEAKKLAELKAKQERAMALKLENDRQMALLNTRGKVVVQVGAFKAKGDAQSTLAKFAGNFPSFARSEVTTAQTDSGTWFRVRFSGIAIDAANRACGLVTRGGGTCQIISR